MPTDDQQQPKKPRRIKGKILDVQAVADAYYDGKADAVYAKVARRTLPFRKHSGRVIFLADELAEFFRTLPGTTLAEAQKNAAERGEDGGA